MNPVAVAEMAAARIPLTVGQIQASPKTEGLTGAASWFWLPGASTRSVSVALAGERVMVTASPSGAQWNFGDGTTLTGGAGVPYRPGTAPSNAVRHTYRTRCLPGDAGHDPYVLSSCGADGYAVNATVSWSITYVAGGPVTASGALPSRTTSSSMTYPVSEARAFLTTSGSGSR